MYNYPIHINRVRIFIIYNNAKMIGIAFPLLLREYKIIFEIKFLLSTYFRAVLHSLTL